MLIGPLPSASQLLLALAVSIVLVAGACLAAKVWRLSLPSWVDRALAGRAAPVVAGLVTAAIVLFVWGSLDQPPVVHDEQAYLLQAEIFASGRWTGTPPPVPALFEQAHVFVEPRLAAKYPPGHSLVLVPGVWLGVPAIVPLLLNFVTGALVFAIVRRLEGAATALLTWALWATSGPSLFWRASYLSENTTTVLWLVAIWFLLSWRESGKLHQVMAVAATVAAMTLTRPLTAVGLAVPIGVVVLVRVWRQRRVPQLLLAIAVALPILCITLLWHERTLGDWRTSPYMEYSRQYFPFDVPGFGMDPTPPPRQVPPEIEWVGQQLVGVHAAHQPAALPKILIIRVVVLFLTVALPWRMALGLLFLAGVGRARQAVRFAGASMVTLMIAYLAFAHPARWTVYYAEIIPGFFFIACCELVRLSRKCFELEEPRLRAAVVLLVVLIAPVLGWEVIAARRTQDEHSGFHRQAAAMLATIPERTAVVFMHYPPGHSHHRSLIENTPDYRTARLWTVYDRGADNDRFLAQTNRPAYRLDVDTWTLVRLR